MTIGTDRQREKHIRSKMVHDWHESLDAPPPTALDPRCDASVYYALCEAARLVQQNRFDDARHKALSAFGMARCRRCGTDEIRQIARPSACLTEAEVAISLNIQRVFDRQQKRAVALFNGGM
jgi:hypothetical protein